MITLDGTRVYVYIKQADYGEKVKYSGSSERIYDFGFDFKDAWDKLVTAAEKIAKCVDSVYADKVPATIDYERVERYEPSDVNNIGTEEAPYELGAITSEERSSKSNTTLKQTVDDDDDW